MTAAKGPSAIAESAFAAAARNDFDEFARYLADGVVWELPPTVDFFPQGRRWEGKEAVLNDFLVGTYAAYYDLNATKLEITAVYGGDQHAVVEFTLTARTTRGRDYKNYYMLFLTITDGLIQSAKEWTNTEYQKRVLVD
jgi:ketosteroid isomerase-like protein